jgi:pyruvate dehydrogenase E2 component (dihydrolipoamide acetyltransferase)
MVTEFRLPEVGEHIENATVVRVLVEPGQVIKKEETIVELETDKATLEVPSAVAGRVKEVRVKPGETIKVGAVILTVEEETGGETGPAVREVPAEGKPAEAPKPEEVHAEIKRDQTLEQTTPVEPTEEEVEQEIKPAIAAATPPVTPAPEPTPQPTAVQPAAPPPSPEEAIPASPAVRRVAREIGVNIADVQGTGPGGRITEDDVKRHARERGAAVAPRAAGPLPEFTRWGEVERQPLPTIRRITGEHMAQSWTTVPHVHQFDKADITDLERLRREHNAALPAGAPKLTMTVVLTKLMAGLLGRYPRFNASIDPAKNELIFKKYINIGIAVDTERGLVVPVIRDVNKKSIRALTVELAALSEKARAGKLAPEEMQGGTFTISNLGGIGGTSFTPIVNYPEAAILGVSRAAEEIVPVGGEPKVRLLLPLSLGYDHRIIDGAEGARFLRDAVVALANPFEVLMEV